MSTHKKFTDLDLTFEDSFSKEKKRKKYKDNEVEENLDHKKFEQENSEEINYIDTSFDQVTTFLINFINYSNYNYITMFYSAIGIL